jgi:hypothetical protein
MAHAKQETLAAEHQIAINHMKEAETLLQKCQHKVAMASLQLQEAKEHIGWMQKHFQSQKLQ